MSGIDDPESYYDDDPEAEWERLEASLVGRLEWEGTVDVLEEYLPSPAGTHVLDVGGGAGRYAMWLAERGYEVTLVDPSDGQRAVAREKVDERGLGDRVTVREDDVRDLDADDAAADATLCLGGPLSHVLDEAERRRAVGELARVTATDGPVIVSVMGLLHLLLINVAAGRRLDLLPTVATTGDYDADLLGDRASAFVETHFFRVEEFETLLEDAGFDVETVVGLEGLPSVYEAGPLRDRTADLSDDKRASLRRLVDVLREDRVVADLSAHLLAACRAPD